MITVLFQINMGPRSGCHSPNPIPVCRRAIMLNIIAGSLLAGATLASQPPGHEPIWHRPGATMVRGPKVSMAQGQYRVFIELSMHDYAPELKAVASFETASNTAITKLKTMKENISETGSDLTLKNKFLYMFHDLALQFKQVVQTIKSEQAELQDLRNVTKIDHHDQEQQANDRRRRDVADYVGLASTAELAELNRWVTQLQVSETKLTHSAEQQLTYLNRTITRINQQENRINQLALVELGWERTMAALRKEASTTPEYLNLLLTLLQGTSAANYMTCELRYQIADDLRRMRMLSSGKMPPDLLSVADLKEIMQDAPIQGNTFSFSETRAYDLAKLLHAPVELLTDDQGHRWYAKLSIPIFDYAHTYQMYQIIPMPTHHPKLPGVQEILDLSETYIAVADNQYFTLDPRTSLYACGDPLRSVPGYMDKLHLCATPHAIIAYQSTGSFASCAASLYYEPQQSLPHTCKTRVQITPTHPIRHLQANIWMYQPGTEGLLRLICSPATKQPNPIELHPNGGQIFMPKNCRGILGQLQLPVTATSETHFALPNTSHLIFRAINTSFWLSNPPIPETTSRDEIVRKIKSSLSKSTQMSMPLDEFKTTLDNIESDLNQNAVTHFMNHSDAAPHAGTVVTVLLLAVIITACCCMGRCCWNRCHTAKRQNSSPQVIPMVTFAPSPNVASPRISPARIEEYRDNSPPSALLPLRSDSSHRSRSRTRRVRSTRRTP